MATSFHQLKANHFPHPHTPVVASPPKNTNINPTQTSPTLPVHSVHAVNPVPIQKLKSSRHSRSSSPNMTTLTMLLIVRIPHKRTLFSSAKIELMICIHIDEALWAKFHESDHSAQ